MFVFFWQDFKVDVKNPLIFLRDMDDIDSPWMLHMLIYDSKLLY